MDSKFRMVVWPNVSNNKWNVVSDFKENEVTTNGEIWLSFGLIFMLFWVTNRHIENQFKRLRTEMAASKDCKYGKLPPDPHTGCPK